MITSNEPSQNSLVIVGGGLSGRLLAVRLSQIKPSLDLHVLDENAKESPPKTWCFHGSDLSQKQMAWLEPLVDFSWKGHEVIFPELRRTLQGSYHCIRSHSFWNKTELVLGSRLKKGARVIQVGPHQVTLSDGKNLSAGCVIDARGSRRQERCGYQKFVGLEIEFQNPHSVLNPILMDATVDQRTGFRFIYTLPFSSSSLLVEDTRYSLDSVLNNREMEEEILRISEMRYGPVKRVLYRESGSLPIPLNFSQDQSDQPTGVPSVGMRAQRFHGTTGYSLPETLKSIDAIENLKEWTTESVLHALGEMDQTLSWRPRLEFGLNRMLFFAARPNAQYRMLEHFYRLPEPAIARFYNRKFRVRDAFRIFAGVPPVPVVRAIHSLFKSEGDKKI